MTMPLSFGELDDFLITALRGRHSAQNEIRNLRVQNLKLQAVAKDAKGYLRQALAEATKAQNEAAEFRQQVAGTATSSVVAQSDMAL